MYFKKYTPEEALQEIKLRMKYSSSKTLNENLELIKEQTNCPNSMPYDELKDIGITAGNIVKKMDASFVRMGYGEERGRELYNILKSLIGKNVYDDITGECVNALDKFKESFKQTGSRGWFQDGFDITEKLNDFLSGYYSNEPEVKRYLNASLKVLNGSSQPQPSPIPSPNPSPNSQRQQNINNIYCSLKNGIITVGKFTGKSWDQYVKKYNITNGEIETAKASCKSNPNPSPSPSPKPKYTYCKSLPFKQGCKNRLIAEFQVCLGLPKKYQTGNFGPITLKAMNEKLVQLGSQKSSVITQEVYNTVISNCGSPSSNDDYVGRKEIVRLDREQRPSTKIGNDLPTSVKSVQLSSPDVSGEQLFNTYVQLKNLYKRGDDWVFKGDNMTKNNLDKISQYLETQGYNTLDKGDKRYGEKFVWKR